MSEELQQKLTDAADNYMEQLEKSHLRKFNQNIHLCAAECLKDTVSSSDYIRSCVSKCAENLKKAKRRMESDLVDIQKRLSRCQQGCHDANHNILGPYQNGGENLKSHEKHLNSCLSKCADEIIAFLPETIKKCQEYFDYDLK